MRCRRCTVSDESNSEGYVITVILVLTAEEEAES